MIDTTYTVIATSAFITPEIFKHLSHRQAQDLAWELKNQQYKVTIEEEDSEVVGLVPNWD